MEGWSSNATEYISTSQTMNSSCLEQSGISWLGVRMPLTTHSWPAPSAENAESQAQRVRVQLRALRHPLRDQHAAALVLLARLVEEGESAHADGTRCGDRGLTGAEARTHEHGRLEGEEERDLS